MALALVERSLERGYRPGIVLIDAGLGAELPIFQFGLVCELAAAFPNISRVRN
jgi:hypothetical protein